MISCPKCGSCFISGPRYEKGVFQERLVYRCTRCGYEHEESCMDAKKDEKPPLTFDRSRLP